MNLPLAWPLLTTPNLELSISQRALYLAYAAEIAPTLANDETLDALLLPMVTWVAHRDRPSILAISGAQGTGKSSMTQLLQRLLVEVCQLRVAAFSLDDFYLTRAERQDLAGQVHPLFTTRGVPGTHDLALVHQVLDQCLAGRVGDRIAIPRFDKLGDERRPKEDWLSVTGPVEVVLFEGWCLGAQPQPATSLAEPVNELERIQDPQCSWRDHVNAQLAGPYQALFSRFHHLFYLKAPGMRQVVQWRLEQERQAALVGRVGMDAARIANFVQYFERLTLWMMETLPEKATLTLCLDDQHRIASVRSAS